MKKNLFLFAALPLFALASCGGNASTSSASPKNASSAGVSSAASSEEVPSDLLKSIDLNLISPTGIPALALYSFYESDHWLSTSTPASYLPPAFASNDYGAIVFDGITGLTLANKNKDKTNYRLARWISTGTFYLVSSKHTADEAFNTSSTIDAFVETGTASQVLRHLAVNAWKWASDAADLKIRYEAGVADVRSILASNPDSYDYYVIAEPVLTALKTSFAKDGKSLNVIYDFQEEWGKLHDGAEIPAAGLFINNNYATEHAEGLKSFLAAIDQNVAKGVDSIGEVKTYLDEAATRTGNAVADRMGFPSALAAMCQKDGANKFALVKSGVIADNRALVNDFQANLGGNTFAEERFL